MTELCDEKFWLGSTELRLICRWARTQINRSEFIRLLAERNWPAMYSVTLADVIETCDCEPQEQG